MSERPIVIFDTTLRDGEQSPGASMNTQEKISVAEMLAGLGVDVIEAGFPVISPGDFESVRQIARAVKGSSVCALARCKTQDIQAAWEAIREAENPRIHVFLATSEIHRRFKLRMTQDEILQHTEGYVRMAAELCPNVEFSAEDASRTEMDFLCRVVEMAIRSGAKTINIPDTVGYAVPEQFAGIIRELRRSVPNIEQAVLSIHCHNDLGMAVANTLCAVEAGAGQVECTINGIGERAGNCALEEIVMALNTRRDYYRAVTRVITEKLLPASQLVSGITGLEVPRNKAIVGRNAFAHESGIHQDGMLKNPTTYEIMRPEMVGFTQTDLVLGKHSGRAALSAKAAALGYTLDDDQLKALFEQFKVLTDRKKDIYDADIRTLIQRVLLADEAVRWTLESYTCSSGSDRKPVVSLKLRHGDSVLEVKDSSSGDGPIDDLFLAICDLTGYAMTCREYRVHSVTVGHDAQGEVNVAVDWNGREYRGRGFSTDCIEATILAFLDAVNRMVREK
ncbi:MAG: 2-isopropylmalate synthase [Planctomycetia bacterium]|nr:2-isopropylmalate synthase [Planctomycetia bacterium]